MRHQRLVSHPLEPFCLAASGCLPSLIFHIGFIHLTRMMATTFTEAKIRVNCIAPGIFPSEMTAGSSGDDQKSTLDMKMSNPAGESLRHNLGITKN